MKQSTGKFQSMMTAITFAEAGEWETAQAFLPRCEMKLCVWLEKFAMATAFAEEGLHEEAMRIGVITKRPSCGCCEIFLDTLGLSEAPMKFGLVASPQLIPGR